MWLITGIGGGVAGCAGRWAAPPVPRNHICGSRVRSVCRAQITAPTGRAPLCPTTPWRLGEKLQGDLFLRLPPFLPCSDRTTFLLGLTEIFWTADPHLHSEGLTLLPPTEIWIGTDGTKCGGVPSYGQPVDRFFVGSRCSQLRISSLSTCSDDQLIGHMSL